MSSYGAYLDAQSAALRSLEISERPTELLSRWEDLIEECEAGYQWDVSELNQDLGVRDLIQGLLERPELQPFTEHKLLREEVGRLDCRFRALLLAEATIPNQTNWWRAGILARAGDAYADYIQGALGIEVEIST